MTWQEELKGLITNYWKIILVGIGLYALTIAGCICMTTIFNDLSTSGEIKRYEAMVEAAEKEVEAAELEVERVTRILNKYGDGKVDVAQLGLENEALNEQLNTAKDKISELEKMIQDYETNKQELEDTIAQLEIDKAIESNKSDIDDKSDNLNSDKYNSDNQIGTYSEFISLDDDCVSNIVRVVQKVNGVEIKPNKKLDIQSLVGPIRGDKFVMDDNDYPMGVEYAIDAIYRAIADAGLAVLAVDFDSSGRAYVDQGTEFMIKNDSDSAVTIQCYYMRGKLTVNIIKGK